MIDQNPQPEIQNPNPPLEAPQPPAQPQSTTLVNPSLRRSPFLAAALSVMPGLGQVYLGYYQIGFIHAIVVAGLLTLLATGDLGPLIPLASVFMAFFWLYNIVDAGRRAVVVNEALAGRGNIDLPENFGAPGLRGTVLGGAVLIVVGLVLLSRTLMGVSLEWLEDWWPVAIVLFGGYLIFKAKSDQVAKSSASLEDD